MSNRQAGSSGIPPFGVSAVTLCPRRHAVSRNRIYITPFFSVTYDWLLTCYIRTKRVKEAQSMELIFTTLAAVGGMSFSLTVALLVEELIFGKVLGLFFARRASDSTPVER